MPKQQLVPIFGKEAAPPLAPYSPAIKVGNLLFISGQSSFTSNGKPFEGSFTEKVHQTFKNIDAVLTAGNSSFDRVAKVNIFLTDINDFAEVNAVYVQYFNKEVKPARSCVAVKELPLSCDIEIELIAVTND